MTTDEDAPPEVVAGAVPAEPQARFVIITGLSGAGRTTAAKALEDLGFFVIDNMPPTLIGSVADLALAPGSNVRRVALVVDVRSREFFGAISEHLDDLRTRGLDVRVAFLEAADEALVRRYEEARRRHPLASDDRVIDGIERERDLLAELRAMADVIIDTTDRSVHDLRDRITAAFGATGDARLAVNVVSFGFKHGTPRDAAMVLDVRFLPNPHWIPELRPHDGTEAPVREYVLGQELTQDFLERLFPLLDLLIPGYVEDGKRYLTLAIGCTGGKHRSVALAERIGEHLRQHDVAVSVTHRDRTNR